MARIYNYSTVCTIFLVIGLCVTTPSARGASIVTMTPSEDSLALAINDVPQRPTLAPEVKTVAKPSQFFHIFQRRFEVEDTFIFTDDTKGNITQFSSQKKRRHINDEWEIGYNFLRNDGVNKRQRFSINTKMELFHLPTIAFNFIRDPVIDLRNMSVLGGLTHKMPGGFRMDYGYGFKWDRRTKSSLSLRKKDKGKFDVWSFQVQNRRKFGKLTIFKRFKTIVPRDPSQTDRQPVYDLRSSWGISVMDNLDGVVGFDWRYEKLPGRAKSDWINYTITFGFKTVLGDKFGTEKKKK